MAIKMRDKDAERAVSHAEAMYAANPLVAVETDIAEDVPLKKSGLLHIIESGCN